MDAFFEYSDRLQAPLEAFSHVTTESNFPILPHWHYFIEVIFINSGHAMACLDNHAYALHPGDMIFFPPRKLHSIDYLPEKYMDTRGQLTDITPEKLWDKHISPVQNPYHEGIYPISKNKVKAKSTRKQGTDANLQYQVIKFDLGSLSADSQLKVTFSRMLTLAYKTDPEAVYFHQREFESFSLTSFFDHCIKEMNRRSFGYDVIVSAQIVNLLTELIRAWMTKGHTLDDVFLNKSDDKHAFHTITEYIQEHYGEPLRIEKLAERCGMSYSYFAKLFRETYHQSCKEYIEFIRITKVTDLLLFTNLDLTYISQETGFADCSHLIRVFRKWKGCTPRQWVKQRKDNG